MPPLDALAADLLALHREAIAKAKADSCDFATALRAVLARRLALCAEDAEREAAIESMLRGAGGPSDAPTQDGAPTQDPVTPRSPPLRRYAEGFRASSTAPQTLDPEREQAIAAMLRGARGDEPDQ